MTAVNIIFVLLFVLKQTGYVPLDYWVVFSPYFALGISLVLFLAMALLYEFLKSISE